MLTKIIEVNIDSIKSGDTILHDGELKTVSKGDIKQDLFMGTSIFGDCYQLGRKPVKKVLIGRAVKDGIIWQ